MADGAIFCNGIIGPFSANCVITSFISLDAASSSSVRPVSFHCAWKFRGIGLLYGTFLSRSLRSFKLDVSKSRPGINPRSAVRLSVKSILSSGSMPGIIALLSSAKKQNYGKFTGIKTASVVHIPISHSSSPCSPAGNVFKLYLSLI